ncbi:hypothetical protein [Microbacterium sp. JB110]|uniref:hypothetical protein n=1 Tax=unclassified Microbacterium TaxID=2609290 RepID=UPI000DF33CCC|nr:hypothetical protein [Microbacterium sp. JB110]RCS61966.1 hypothetical protein CIK77_04470 [Microbacterium sp. JB110]
MSTQDRSPLTITLVVAVSVAGAVAVISFVLSLLLAAPASDAMRTVAIVAAGVSAVIGVCFALVGARR